MSTDTPPEVILSKYSTSFTAHKGAFNDFIMSFTSKRKNFAATVCDPTVREIAKYLIAEKLINMPHPDFFKNPIIQMAALSGNWLGPVPKHINPLQEINAKVVEVENAFKLRSSVGAENGIEFDNYIEEWQQEENQFRKGSPEEQATAVTENEDENEDDDSKPEELVE
jgi:capsid protein